MSEIVPFPGPRSPHLRNYRPQLTSVLSFTHRVSGVVLALGAVGLVGWLVAAASGPASYASFHVFLGSPPGQVLLVIATFALFLHLLGGLRHLAWDAVLGFELRSIYASGWAVVAAALLFTAAAWCAALLTGG